MDKAAFRSVAGKFRHVKRVLQTSPVAVKTTVGAGAGAVLGGATTHAGNKATESSDAFKEMTPKQQKNFQKTKKLRVAVGALSGAYLGGSTAHDFASIGQKVRRGGYQAKARPRSSSGEAPAAKVKDMGTPEWLKGVSTKAEAKSKFRQQAGVHHPDRGGDENKMKTINAEWDSFQKHKFHKLSHSLTGFFDELGKIYRK